MHFSNTVNRPTRDYFTYTYNKEDEDDGDEEDEDDKGTDKERTKLPELVLLLPPLTIIISVCDILIVTLLPDPIQIALSIQ